MKDGVPLASIGLGTFNSMTKFHEIDSDWGRINAYVGEEKISPCDVGQR